MARGRCWRTPCPHQTHTFCLSFCTTVLCRSVALAATMMLASRSNSLLVRLRHSPTAAPNAPACPPAPPPPPPACSSPEDNAPPPPPNRRCRLLPAAEGAAPRAAALPPPAGRAGVACGAARRLLPPALAAAVPRLPGAVPAPPVWLPEVEPHVEVEPAEE